MDHLKVCTTLNLRLLFTRMSAPGESKSERGQRACGSRGVAALDTPFGAKGVVTPNGCPGTADRL